MEMMPYRPTDDGHAPSHLTPSLPTWGPAAPADWREGLPVLHGISLVAPAGRITNEDWVTVGGGDGFYAQIDPTDPDLVYSESQGGNIQRRDLRTWQARSIRPGRPPQRLLVASRSGAGSRCVRSVERTASPLVAMAGSGSPDAP